MNHIQSPEYRPDYFAPTTPVETILRRIKGNYRRELVTSSIAEDGFDSIPGSWLDHDTSDHLKSTLGRSNPNYRGGEDLPDLVEGGIKGSEPIYQLKKGL